MISYTIEIPEALHREILEQRHHIDVGGVCQKALADAVLTSRDGMSDTFQFGRDVAEDITRMFDVTIG